MRLETTGRFPSIDHRKRQIHENEVRPFTLRRSNSRLAVRYRDQLEFLFEQLREQVPIEFDILDYQDFFHCIAPPAGSRIGVGRSPSNSSVPIQLTGTLIVNVEP